MQRPMSLSKMPAPAPVMLPTADDILPSPPSSPTGSPRLYGRMVDEEARVDIPDAMRHRPDQERSLPRITESTLEVDLVAPSSSSSSQSAHDGTTPVSLLTDLNETESASLGAPHPTTPGGSVAEDLQELQLDAPTTSKTGPVDDLLSDSVVSPPAPAVTHTRKDSRL